MNGRPKKRDTGELAGSLRSLSRGLASGRRRPTLGPLVDVDRPSGPTIDTATRPSTPPLLLLPMRLEYRVIERRDTPVFADTRAELEALERADRAPSPTLRAAARDNVLSEVLATRIRSAPLQLRSSQEIWFRWYPDEGFSEKGIAPATENEVLQLTAFQEAIGQKPWHDVSDPDVAAAWANFTGAVGPYRALHLLRSGGTDGDENWEQAIGRIAALPDQVTVFAVTGSSVTALATGASIPQNTGAERSVISYTPHAAEPGEWLHDFSIAEKNGMALKLSDEVQVAAALGADWIVALGTHASPATAELERLLSDGIANGSFEFLPQDVPTNNSPGSRSVYANPGQDLLTFIGRAAEEEAGAFGASGTHAATLLAEALGIDPAPIRKAVSAADQGYEDARAMLRVIGPALLDDAVDGLTSLPHVDENQFIDILSAAFVARGVLPAVRFGKNAFGVLPMTKVSEFQPQGDPSDTRVKVQKMLAGYTSFLKPFLAVHADDVVPVLAPDDPAASDKVERILKVNRVSRRIDVGDEGSDETASIGCPYVTGRLPEYQPGVYLAELRTKSVKDLPDPTAADKGWPLLYRLARLSLVRNTLVSVLKDKRPTQSISLNSLERMDSSARDALFKETSDLLSLSVASLAVRTSPIRSVDDRMRERFRTVNRDFAAALERLEHIARRPTGTAELETLMLEVIDLFQHRIDAWAVGLAYARLSESRQKGQKGLQAGYYGLLGKLRPTSATGTGDGYIQAPSIAQATSAAILRSAYLRHRSDGAFEIDLRSRRVRRALALIDMLKKGLSLQEGLGLRGERWLHDKRLSRLTLPLRTEFPISNPASPESAVGTAGASPKPAGHRVFDGMKFVAADLGAFGAADRALLQGLQSLLADDLDALSDVVVAEAVHQRAIGQAEAANAWLQILAGEPVPGDPLFLRTQRHGQGSTHRVSVLLEGGTFSATSSPRAIAEPALAGLARDMMPGFEDASFTLAVSRTADPAQSLQITVKPASDLGMEPLDLVIGGASELQVRARHHLIGRWLTDEALSNQLGMPVALGLQAFVNGELAITVDLAGGPPPSLDTHLAAASRMRRLIQRARPLEPSDLNASASPNDVLREEVEMTLLASAVARLRERVTALEARLRDDLASFAQAKATFLDRVREARRLLDAGSDDETVVMAAVSAEAARRALNGTLRAVAAYAEPEALRPFTVEEAIANPDGLSETLDAMQTRLETKRQALVETLSLSVPASTDTLQAARATQRALVESLQATLDGEGLPILPPIPKDSAVTPLLDPSVELASALIDWRQVREGVRNALDGLAGLPGVRAHAVSPAATEDDLQPDDEDPRAEEEAPRSRHFGTYLGTDEAVLNGEAFIGLVCDEWAEQRPSESQMAALALNYDSPQSEPPHCLLLCVPPKEGVTSWTPERAAETVVEAIDWMKIRALSTDQKPTPASLLPHANQVPFKKVGHKATRRIPKREFRLKDLGGLALDGEFVLAQETDAEQPLGVAGAGLNQVRGFFNTKE